MRRLISSTPLRVAALLWVVGFLVVFVPAHRRGIITLGNPPAGTASSAQAGQSGEPYCPLCVVADPGEPVPADAPVNCAVCALKAGLDLPAAVVEPPRFFEEIDYVIGRFSASSTPTLASQITLHGRAPPVA